MRSIIKNNGETKGGLDIRGTEMRIFFLRYIAINFFFKRFCKMACLSCYKRNYKNLHPVFLYLMTYL
jgi:hypothetical protein